MTQMPEPEFSRPVVVDALSPEEEREITAKPEERKALAKRFGVVSVDSLSARLHLKRIAGGRLIRLSGHLDAKVVQTCVITLEPVPQTVSEDFTLVYAPPGQISDDPAELHLSLDAEDPPEPIQGGQIDLGEAVAEHLALGLDPFPRKAGAEIPQMGDDDQEEEAPERPNPFAKLAVLKKTGD